MEIQVTVGAKEAILSSLLALLFPKQPKHRTAMVELGLKLGHLLLLLILLHHILLGVRQ